MPRSHGKTWRNVEYCLSKKQKGMRLTLNLRHSHTTSITCTAHGIMNEHGILRGRMINLYLNLITDCTLFVQILLYFVFRYVFENKKDMGSKLYVLVWFGEEEQFAVPGIFTSSVRYCALLWGSLRGPLKWRHIVLVHSVLTADYIQASSWFFCGKIWYWGTVIGCEKLNLSAHVHLVWSGD